MQESKRKVRLMNLLWSGLRLLGFVSVGFGAGVLANVATHQNYWKGTIYSVQTVDFNILSHVLPYKVSALILAGNKEEIQRTINSNYRIFGIVITDCTKDTVKCPEQKILYSNKPRSEIDSADLQTQHFNYLKNPPPLSPEQRYRHSYADNPVNTELINPGVIIGRIYYVRGKPPSFLDDYTVWLTKHFIRFSIGRSQRYYIYFAVQVALLLLAFLGWIVNEIQLRFGELKLRQAQEAQQLLKTENELLRISTFNNVFVQLIDQEFTSPAANIAQRLSNALFSIMARLKTDTQNIIHDINKTPLLLASSFDLIEDLKRGLSKAEETDHIIEEMSKLITTTSDSVETLKVVIEDLRNFSDLEGEMMDVNDQLLILKEQLHPSVKRWNVDFDLHPASLMIKCNSWRFRSIVKNALYNSSHSLENRELDCLEEDETFEGKIRVFSCMIENKISVSIVDNGCGIPEYLIPELYKTDKRLNTSDGEIRGNGSIIINAYLNLHEGEARVFNNEDSGATVQFLFPLAHPKNQF